MACAMLPVGVTTNIGVGLMESTRRQPAAAPFTQSRSLAPYAVRRVRVQPLGAQPPLRLPPTWACHPRASAASRAARHGRVGMRQRAIRWASMARYTSIQHPMHLASTGRQVSMQAHGTHGSVGGESAHNALARMEMWMASQHASPWHTWKCGRR
eukprot:361729-Chlamydomonas_euryale.AAC.1